MPSLIELSEQLGLRLAEQNHVLTSAESCTGGGIATAITDIAGSSAWFDRAFITYSNEAKVEMLGVSNQTLRQHGAVSEPIVLEMVEGALQRSNATIAVSVSGIAGPGGGSEHKPVGTVCFAFASRDGWLEAQTCYFAGDRSHVRAQAIEYSLSRIFDYLDRN